MNKLNYQNLICFDLETSGLDFNEHEIIQISAIDLKTGDSFNQLLDFNIDKADEAALVANHFDENRWDEEAVPAEVGLSNFANFVQNHASLERTSKAGKEYKVAALCGYNILGFDKFFLEKGFKQHRIFFPADYRMFDIFQIVLWKYPNLSNYGLGHICNHLGIETDNLHDALSDVKATIEVMKQILSTPLNFDKVDF